MTPRFNVLLRCVCLLMVMANVQSKSTVKMAGSYFNLCRRGDPKELNECVKNSIMSAKPLLKKGIPALKIIPIEPMVFPRFEVGEGSGNFLFKVMLTNFTIHGMGDYTVTNTNVKLDDKHIEFTMAVTLPDLKMTGKYEMDGQILVIPIRGKGDFEMNLTDVSATALTRGNVSNHDGQQFIEINDMKWDFAINGKARSWFYNLFNGDKRLGDATNNFLNENGLDAFQTYKHLPEEAFSQLFKEIAANVFRQYPVKELFVA